MMHLPPMIWPREWRLVLWITFSVAGWSANSGLAGFGYEITVPQMQNRTPGYSKQSGLQLAIDTRWVGERGYRPVHIEVKAQKAATADQQLTVRFAALNRRNRKVISVEQDFELSQGNATASIRLLVPQFVDWNTNQLEVWVDGIKDEDLSIGPVGLGRTDNNSKSFALTLPGSATNSVAAAFLPQFLAEGRIEVGIPAEWPQTWADYSMADVVLVASPNLLKEAKTDAPLILQELSRWVRAGGNLWIFRTGSDFRSIPTIESALGIASSESSPKETSQDSDYPFWHVVPLRGTKTSGIDALLGLRSPRGYGNLDPLVLEPPGEDSAPAIDSFDLFLVRAYGMGTVTVFPGRQSNTISRRAIDAADRSLLGERMDWRRRHGTDPSRSNPEFNNFLIPDVGMAPVFEFQLLISLFVIGIGPVNYWLLKRQGRLPLLLVTVPTAAAATTLLLFAYGFLSEGVGTRVRVRSFTWLDQPAGEIACWSRLSYYAGVAPSEGLRMPADTLVYPILPATTDYRATRRYANQPRELLWNEGAQQDLSRGWLASRTPTQYLTITARPTEKRLEFESVPQGFEVTNRLGVEVLALAVQDDQGNFFLGDSCSVDATAKLTAGSKYEALLKMRSLLADRALQFPIGADIRSRGGFSRRDYGYEPLTRNLMETHLAALTSPVSQGWGKLTYVALTQQGLEVELGLDGVAEEHSCHVIRGSW